MIHYTQGYKECFPTCLGMFLEKEPRTVIKEILGKDLDKYSWSYAWSMASYTDIGKELFIKVQSYLESYIPWLPVEAFQRNPKASWEPSLWPKALPTVKFGFITTTILKPVIVQTDYGEAFIAPQIQGRHIIGFDGVNQRIYDGNLPGTMDYRTYAQYQWDSLVDGIYYPDTEKTCELI